MSAAAATVSAHGGRKARQRRLLVMGGAVLALVLVYMLVRKQAGATTTSTSAASPAAPTWDPSTGEWIDPNTGLPVNQPVNAAANNDPGASSDPLAGLGGPLPVTLVDASGNPVSIPTGGSDNGNAGTGSSSAPPPGGGGPTGGGAPPGSSAPPAGGGGTGAPTTQPPPAPAPVADTASRRIGAITVSDAAFWRIKGIAPPAGASDAPAAPEPLYAVAPAPHAASTPVEQPVAPPVHVNPPVAPEHAAAFPPPRPHITGVGVHAF